MNILEHLEFRCPWTGKFDFFLLAWNVLILDNMSKILGVEDSLVQGHPTNDSSVFKNFD